MKMLVFSLGSSTVAAYVTDKPKKNELKGDIQKLYVKNIHKVYGGELYFRLIFHDDSVIETYYPEAYFEVTEEFSLDIGEINKDKGIL